MNTGAPVVSAHDVARELRERLPDGTGVTKIHKLLYYCQGWHLSWAGRPLFYEPIEAWPKGPVVAVLWADEKHDRGRPSPSAVEDDGMATIDYVLGRYGRFTGKELIRLTHLEDPWRDATENESDPDPSPQITNQALQSWFDQDDDHVAHVTEVSSIRQRMEAFLTQPLLGSPGMAESVDRALRGERVLDSRPA